MLEDLSTLAPGLTLDPAGYWSAHARGAPSYPAEGNENSFSIEETSFWFRHRNLVITDMLRLYPPGGLLFDIGGGNGYVAKGLEETGFPCVVVEPGPTGASNALKRGLRTVVCAAAEDVGFLPETIPAVGLFDVLEHVEDDHSFLRFLHSLMKPDGRIYLTVPAFQMLWSSEDEYAGHHRRYSIGTLAETLRACGYTVEFASYFFWPLVVPVFLLRTLPSRAGFRQAKANEAIQKREHSTREGPLGRLLQAALSVERDRLQGKRLVPFGGSCFVVARKIDSFA